MGSNSLQTALHAPPGHLEHCSSHSRRHACMTVHFDLNLHRFLSRTRYLGLSWVLLRLISRTTVVRQTPSERAMAFSDDLSRRPSSIAILSDRVRWERFFLGMTSSFPAQEGDFPSMAAATEAARRQGAQSRRLTDLKHEIELFECHLMQQAYGEEACTKVSSTDAPDKPSG